MTKKDYELLAAFMLKSKPPYPDVEMEMNLFMYSAGQYDTWQFMVLGLANILEQENSKFKRDKFIKACGLIIPDEANA